MRRDFDDADDYNARLAAAVVVGLRQAVHFEDLCHRTHGAAPQDIIAKISKSDFDRLRGTTVSPLRSDLDRRTPEPHPIDYDWRFNLSTVKFLTSLTKRFENILCVGTPTVFDLLAKTGRRATLVDRNAFLAKALSEFPHARLIFDEIEVTDLSSATYDAAILDPPWYPCEYDTWLDKVIPALRPGGTILLTLFRELTRPSAHKELGLLLDSLSRVGRVNLIPAAATYVTPRFELEVLQQVGAPTLHSWRQGDIAEVVLFPDSRNWINPPVALPKRKWRRFLLGDQVVATAIRDDDNGPVSYRGLADARLSFQLTSVSNRDAQRERIDVWTSRNRGAQVSGIQRVCSALAAIAESPENQDRLHLPLTTADYSSFHNLLADVGLLDGTRLDA